MVLLKFLLLASFFGYLGFGRPWPLERFFFLSSRQYLNWWVDALQFYGLCLKFASDIRFKNYHQRNSSEQIATIDGDLVVTHLRTRAERYLKTEQEIDLHVVNYNFRSKFKISYAPKMRFLLNWCDFQTINSLNLFKHSIVVCFCCYFPSYASNCPRSLCQAI